MGRIRGTLTSKAAEELWEKTQPDEVWPSLAGHKGLKSQPRSQARASSDMLISQLGTVLNSDRRSV